jgi:hypothetical protein
MDKYREMRAFAAVVTAGSFSRAADTRETSKAAVSKQIAELERRLDVLTRLPTQLNSRIDELLPHRWQPSR